MAMATRRTMSCTATITAEKRASVSSIDDAVQEPASKKLRRSYVACHSHKIKCSGETPCRSCRKSNNSTQCVYPVRDRKVVISESYLKKLEEENASLKCTTPSSTIGTSPGQVSPEDNKQDIFDGDSEVDVANVDVVNPLLEEHSRPAPYERASGKPLYIGGAACSAFGTRLRYYVKGGDTISQPRRMVCYKHRGLLRIANTEFQLPNKTYARMLVQVVLRFTGSDYHLIQRKSFMKRLEETYSAQTHDDPVFLCRLFVVFALGELYSKKASVSGNRRMVPGIAFFLQAMSLFQDLHEEADVEYIETLLVMSFYSHALNRKNTAYTYAGLALRLSLTLGLHRNITFDSSTSPVEIENRRRVWWTVYTFDRLTSSKLGHPVMVRDEDIDAPFPSVDGLTLEQREEFVGAEQLVANIKLAQITGQILNLIYCIPNKDQETTFVRNMHKILNSLKEWDAMLPDCLRLDPKASPPYRTRSVASLRLHFNQCVVLATRPILLYVFKYHVRPTHGTVASPSTAKPLSPMTTALSEACIHAARSSNKLLAQLWIDGSIATFGYFDAHYIFSSTIVLLMANILYPSESDKESIDLAWSLLQTMADDGNLPASEYCERLVLLQKDLDDMCGDSQSSSMTATTPPNRSLDHDSKIDPRLSSTSSFKQSPQSDQISPTTVIDPQQFLRGAAGPSPPSSAPLDDPFIQDFLTQPDNQWSPGTLDVGGDSSIPWAFSWEAGELQSQFASA
ncbi:uncharacterized protein K452DRAFT_302600 [Aplosporella prunicola CBS 121167]|uniref:Zn(2)-C6 fungal-type domain-containing protein n=1 Tax=Aplosporella prunicola CBS 121167 TaxID=1176127 RepID=A0A6A6B0V4_9PEZI|nr:uncharacterized protein K452DRAFT_302600 [Aplosporella prunicola CBS 121167]KAF2136657.1 hypothetical protein K452DRAFT_302600 [Aplosporella prunicola CBS 121167]